MYTVSGLSCLNVPIIEFVKLVSDHLCSVSWPAATHRQLFNNTLLKINRELSYLQFELRACINQYDATVYYGVVNNIADEESKLGSKYSVPQIAFYKGLVCSHFAFYLAQSSIVYVYGHATVSFILLGCWKQ